MKGSPGGILALAIGAVFLALGWNGRYVAVWEALRTGESQTIGKPSGIIPQDNGSVIDAGNDQTGDERVIMDPVYVTKVSGGGSYIVDAPDLFRSRSDGTCAVQATAVKITSYPGGNATDPNTVWCVDKSKLSSMVGGGQVISNSAANLLPNGTMSVRYQPNATGIFDA